MLRFLRKRLLSLVGVLFVLTIGLFILQQLSPIDPVRAMLGDNASTTTVEAVRTQLGLDQPVYVQYLDYVMGLFRGDLGTSYQSSRPVAEELTRYAPATFELGGVGLIFAILLGVLFAVSTLAIRPVLRVSTGLYRGVVLLGAAAPPFLLGLLGIIVFYRDWGILPASGRLSDSTFSGPTGFMLVDTLAAGRPDLFVDALEHLVLPALCIAIGPSLVIGRVFASSLRGTLDFDYVRTARAKGLTEPWIVRRHVLRNASNPVLSLVGLQIGGMFAGALVVESIFSWPGLGSYMERAISTSDFPALAAVVLILGVGFVTVNTLVEIVQAAIDPRLRVSG